MTKPLTPNGKPMRALRALATLSQLTRSRNTTCGGRRHLQPLSLGTQHSRLSAIVGWRNGRVVAVAISGTSLMKVARHCDDSVG